MGLVSGVWLALLGILGAASLIIAKRPDAKQMIDKLTPYQGWIGAVSAIWGAWNTISAVLHISILGSFPIWWITWTGSAVIQLLLGFLLGIGVLKTLVKNPAASAKMDQTLVKLAPYQGTLGLVSIGFGIWTVLAALMFSA